MSKRNKYPQPVYARHPAEEEYKPSIWTRAWWWITDGYRWRWVWDCILTGGALAVFAAAIKYLLQ